MVSIFSDSWIDLVFEGRNQQYGAFELRKKVPRNSFIAGLISLSMLGAGISIPIIVSLLIGSHQDLVIIPDTPPTWVPVPNPTVIPSPKHIPQPPPAAPHASSAVPTDIVPDKQMPQDVPPPKDNPIIDNSPGTSTGNTNTPAETTPGGTGTSTGTTILSSPPVDNKIFTVAEVMPAFPGGEAALLRYVGNNVVYPEVSKANDIEGTVYVQFVVDREGNVTDVKVLRPVDKFLDREAIRVISSLPKWTPGMQNGQKVPVQCVLPIRFQLR